MTEEITVRRRLLGAQLRRLRESCDLTLDEAATTLECSASKISRIETGHRGIRVVDLRLLLDRYGMSEVVRREAFTEMARQSRRQDWWSSFNHVLASAHRDYIGLEERASVINAYQPQLVPGLFQTEEYTRAVARATRLGDDEAVIDNAVTVRLARQRLLAGDAPPRLGLVLDESVLRRPVGSAEVLAKQLDHLLEIGMANAVLLQVLPLAAGAHAALEGGFTILEFPDVASPSVIYVQSLTGGLFIDNAVDVERYRLTFEHLRATALPAHMSRDVIRAAIKELRP